MTSSVGLLVEDRLYKCFHLCTADQVEDCLYAPPARIYYCSRTHSQLVQFLNEMKRTEFASCFRIAYLGSRNQLCINPAVSSLQNPSIQNDKCIELQGKASKGSKVDGGSGGDGDVGDDDGDDAEEARPAKRRKTTGENSKACPFYNQQRIERLQHLITAFSWAPDETKKRGSMERACPYYASRYTAAEAELILLPYNTLLHKSSRASCQLSLQNSLVIIDEAHNLAETLSNMYSVFLFGDQLSRALAQLNVYYDRYCARLSADNVRYVQQLQFVLERLNNVLAGKRRSTSTSQTPSQTPSQTSQALDKASQTNESIFTINDFLFESNLDHIRLYELVSFCRNSNLARKLLGIDRLLLKTNERAGEETKRPASSPLMQVVEFLDALTLADSDGRVLASLQPVHSKSFLKFLLLNSVVHFKQVCDEARSVVIAGGTMQPMDDLIEELFTACHIPTSRINQFTCGHVVPLENLFAAVVLNDQADDRQTGRRSKPLNFSFANQQREMSRLMEALVAALADICEVVPAGVVVFLPSYRFMQCFREFSSGCHLFQRITNCKKVFFESTTEKTETLLKTYSDHIEHAATADGTTNGAMLLAVVGGRLSEGINFSDDLGRCVVMVGMPYANRDSIELREKMKFIERTTGDPSASQRYYENLCMKSVNQCIGRVIRHRNDFGSIVFLDERYAMDKVRRKLPGWVAGAVSVVDGSAVLAANLKRFFQLKTGTF